MNILAVGLWHVCAPRLQPVVDELNAQGHHATFMNCFPDRTNAWSKVKMAYEELNPDCILTACDYDMPAHELGRATIRYARQRSVRCVNVQHGFYSIRTVELSISDMVCAWGEFYRPYINTTGTIVCTGNPTLDHNPYERGDGNYILFCANMAFPGLMGTRRDAVKEAVEELKKVCPVVIRPHPSGADDMEFYKTLDCTIDDRTPLEQLYMNACCVAGNSSVLIEAAVQGIPGLWIQDVKPSVCDQQSIIWYSGSDSVEQVLCTTVSEEFILAHNTAVPGNACKKISEVILHA